MKKNKFVLILLITLLVLSFFGLLLQANINNKEKVLSDEEYITQLNIAISNENIQEVKELLKEDRNLNQYPKFYDEDDSVRANLPLEKACDVGNYEIVKLLLDNDADVNYNENGNAFPALYLALTSQHREDRTDIVKLLIQNGANVNLNINNETLLEIVASTSIKNTFIDETKNNIDAVEQNYEIFKLLIDNGSNINIHKNNLLKNTVISGNHLILKYLIEMQNFDYNVLLSDNQSLLILSIQYNQTEISQYLISKGVDINVKDTNGKTALDYAKESNNQELIELLQ